MIKQQHFLTILMPCLNEAETLETCIRKVQKFFKKYPYSAEILIADNGSTDGSDKIALKNGTRVIPVKKKGDRNTLMNGIKSTKDEFIVMDDADDSLVMGNSFIC